MAEHERTPAGVDPSRPNSARVFDYLLGGKDNYEVDQQVAHRMLAVAPDTRTLAWFSRQFLLGGVRHAAEAGVRQFLDLGSGLPTSPNVHETAREYDERIPVVAVDNDPVVLVHSNAILTGIDGVTALLGDVRDVDDIVERVRAQRLLDFDRPIGVLLVGVLHFVMDDERPAEILRRLRAVLAPGSYVVFTHGAAESNSEFIERSENDTVGSPAQVAYRSAEQVRALFDGFELLEPGVAPIQDWLGDDLPETKLVLLGGIAEVG
ncbi:SAM-dependent methyltransferase [Nocardia asteroides]|uniref:SAM-dependent methyltransferase n=1 Tax=Nocardia asteroides TaxID=1824 RepID=UPI001E587D1B|nr:SAM-dependent methyltransferase [Nocardia asteroides]UGT63983.1 SAM-dependent methyltransferase [Nocardia asteroides]